jgi:hypothetical protein
MSKLLKDTHPEVPELAELLQSAEDLAFSWVDPDAL